MIKHTVPGLSEQLHSQFYSSHTSWGVVNQFWLVFAISSFALAIKILQEYVYFMLIAHDALLSYIKDVKLCTKKTVLFQEKSS